MIKGGKNDKAISQTFGTRVSEVKRHATLQSNIGMVIPQGAKKPVLGKNSIFVTVKEFFSSFSYF